MDTKQSILKRFQRLNQIHSGGIFKKEMRPLLARGGIHNSFKTYIDSSLMNELTSISVDEVSSEEFFSRYISTRQPIKFRNQLHDLPWNVNSWTNQYLKEMAGKSQVKVEYREDSQGRFGKGNEETMEFGKFIDNMSSGDQRWYLTTQKLDYSAEGQPMIVSHPITELLGDIPIRPTLMGNLIPQNINLWMGNSDRPTSSGLHHDFHDNLYILLRGHKTLVLYPPAEYQNMYLVGKVSKLHSNGRFNYQGQPTRADGSSIGSEEALRASKLLDEAVLKLENEESGAEDEIEDALEKLLDAQTEGFEGNEEDEDDYQDSDIEETSEQEEGDDDESCDGKEAEYLGLKRTRQHETNGDQESSKKVKSNSISCEVKLSESDEEEESLSKKEPPSFSRVDTDASREVLERDFPLFLESESKGLTVSLEPGEMLYLPAGWFHEVRSSGSPAGGGHMALNYWFHPPDGSAFEKPYQSDFWENDWKLRNN